ncbi:peptide synthetase [Xylariales sp. AK1849]|nr:peptide synthetase [Xylariales sp. AK1849]
MCEIEYGILARVLIKEDGSFEMSIFTRTSKISAFQAANVAHTLAKTLVESLDAHPQSTIGELDIFSQRDHGRVMEWNQSLPGSINACFHQQFEAVVQKGPEAPAICSWDRNFTYCELDTLSKKIGNHLVNLAAGPEMLILICFDKSSIAIASMLGIFKVGGAFVALDPSYPASRIQAIAEATNASIVVTDPVHSHLFEGIVEHIVSLDHKSADEFSPTPSAAPRQPSPSNTAYVVFTSGSTGAPKGIMVEHRALCTAVHSLAAPMRVSATSRFLQFAAYTFDLSYGDIFVTLSQGGCICIPSEHERVNDLAGAIVRMNVNTACLIPSVARIFRPDDVPCLETLLLGGEALLKESLEVWGSKVALAQMYGPSEATVWCTAQTGLKADGPANNIGRGLAVRLWVTSVANHDRLCPVGCIGELLIEGPVLARGYLNAQQTASSFIQSPRWAGAESGQRRRFYKTGDLVRYDPDGSLRFIGRKYTQIKFHGRRIEMGEIEYHLSSHPLLRQFMVTLPSTGIYAQRLTAVVVLKTSKPSKHGVSELKAVPGIAGSDSGSELEKMKGLLSSKVPSYMLPQFWVVVEEIPLMISGKMNRVLAKKFVESLSEEEGLGASVNGDHAKQDVVDAVEIRLRDIWSRILNRNIIDIGVESEFHSLGGDSFSAMEIVAICKAEGLALTVQNILNNTTIREMASVIKMQSEHGLREACRSQDYSVLPLQFAPAWWDMQPTLGGAGTDVV